MSSDIVVKPISTAISAFLIDKFISNKKKLLNLSPSPLIAKVVPILG